jgi:hypothetical protein
MVPVLAILRHEEGVRLNPDPLVALYQNWGNAAQNGCCSGRLMIWAHDLPTCCAMPTKGRISR